MRRMGGGWGWGCCSSLWNFQETGYLNVTLREVEPDNCRFESGSCLTLRCTHNKRYHQINQSPDIVRHINKLFNCNRSNKSQWKGNFSWLSFNPSHTKNLSVSASYCISLSIMNQFNMAVNPVTSRTREPCLPHVNRKCPVFPNSITTHETLAVRSMG